ncbi:hypothetical protein L3X07_14310 [Levilactobacillus brevis]|nr:hypothetical protein [Levilactobacillus brevis]
MEKIKQSQLFDTLSKKMVWGFVFLITIGTVLLSLPVATNGMRGLPLLIRSLRRPQRPVLPG